ncbi:MAG: asparagine synthase (glutamine-hydrolyzing) [Gemmatimonadetes bacterium]|nr:asparagine synthase (glutamine-hydrolyzing) [Gemmatimonadota bacterium]
MCGIGGVLDLEYAPVPGLGHKLYGMNQLLAHRGPDGQGVWAHESGRVGFAHRRLSIIDLSGGHQPMLDAGDNVVTYNGEIYNYLELRDELGREAFRTASDTEVILRAYRRWGPECVTRFRGMFAFALWDEQAQRLFCARDRFGIKPFYYTVAGGRLYFASEVKALLPFVDQVETDLAGFKDYLAFQFCLGGKTLFKGIHELPPGHVLTASNGVLQVRRYWEVYYHIDFDHTARYFEQKLEALLEDSVRVHLRSDVPLGAYVSGGLDSGVIAALAARQEGGALMCFTGKYSLGPEYDESGYARALAGHCGFPLVEREITSRDFVDNIRDVIYHLDFPVAGPGSFSQYMISETAARHRKVVLGGQGGDEIFGGYTRYLIAYFEQCIKAAIQGTMNDGNFVVTYQSIIPNLVALRGYEPMLQEFFRDGLFEPMDRRYFRLVNRAPHLGQEIRWDALGDYSPFDTFGEVFNGANVGKESYFDRMTHFDFKTLLPALLQVEDRVSMAHGLESRVPLLDHPLIEFAATIPADVKFKDGHMKHVFRQTFQHLLPRAIVERTDKMGFPTPFTRWVNGEARDFVHDVFSSTAARGRALVDNARVLEWMEKESRFGRNTWGLLCLELWHAEFHDRPVRLPEVEEPVRLEVCSAAGAGATPAPA